MHTRKIDDFFFTTFRTMTLDWRLVDYSRKLAVAIKYCVRYIMWHLVTQPRYMDTIKGSVFDDSGPPEVLQVLTYRLHISTDYVNYIINIKVATSLPKFKIVVWLWTILLYRALYVIWNNSYNTTLSWRLWSFSYFFVRVSHMTFFQQMHKYSSCSMCLKCVRTNN